MERKPWCDTSDQIGIIWAPMKVGVKKCLVKKTETIGRIWTGSLNRCARILRNCQFTKSSSGHSWNRYQTPPQNKQRNQQGLWQDNTSIERTLLSTNSTDHGLQMLQNKEVWLYHYCCRSVLYFGWYCSSWRIHCFHKELCRSGKSSL